MDERKAYEQADLDYRVNKYSIKCLGITQAVMAVMLVTNLLHIFIVDMKLMAVGISIASVIVIGTIIFSRVVDLHKKWVKYVIIFHTVLAITVLGVTLTYHVVLLSVLPLLLATQYCDKKILRFTYVMSVISIFVIVMGGYFWGLCDANMLALTTMQTKEYFDAATNTIHFEASNANPWLVLPLYYVLPRCMILFLLNPVIQRISENIMDYVEYAADMKHRSETDDMTGLYNKNKYLRMERKYYPKYATVGVIFWDVNNLKQTNDTLGHEEGDSLINRTAKLIKELTGVNRKAYRIGGDEFVMVVTNPAEGEMDAVLKQWNDIVDQEIEVSGIPYSVAVGMAVGKGKHIESVVKEADERMYRTKLEQKS